MLVQMLKKASVKKSATTEIVYPEGWEGSVDADVGTMLVAKGFAKAVGGVVVDDAKAKADAEAQAKADAEAHAKAKADAEAQAKAETKAKTPK